MNDTSISDICFLIVTALILLTFVLCLCCGCCDEDGRADQPAAESAEQRVDNPLAPPVLLPLPYFTYAAQPQSDKPSETVVCAICLEPLRPWQLCSEVPPCRHVFHGDCLGEWARSNGSCPLCRAKIVPGSKEVAIADNMV